MQASSRTPASRCVRFWASADSGLPVIEMSRLPLEWMKGRFSESRRLARIGERHHDVLRFRDHARSPWKASPGWRGRNSGCRSRQASRRSCAHEGRLPMPVMIHTCRGFLSTPAASPRPQRPWRLRVFGASDGQLSVPPAAAAPALFCSGHLQQGFN